MALRHIIRGITNRRANDKGGIGNVSSDETGDGGHRSDKADSIGSDYVNCDASVDGDDSRVDGGDSDSGPGRTSSVVSAGDESDDRIKLSLDAFGMLPRSTPYDVVIRINSLAALKTSGWEIVLGQNAKSMSSQVSTSEDGRGVIVAVLGSYNRGKSFLINQLCNINLPNGSLIHTEGISMTAGTNQAENVIFIDTAGTDTAILKDQLSDKKATEALLKEIALGLCSHVIIVVNRLRATDQSYIRQVVSHCKTIQERKVIMIVHNLSDVETQEDINKLIVTEVKDLFKATPGSMNLPINGSYKIVNYFSSREEDIEIRHFLFAKHGSSAAQSWNQQSIDCIISILQTATLNRRSLDVVPEIIKYVNNRLPQIFNNNYEDNDRSGGNNRQKFQVLQHSKKPCIVLSRRQDLDDLEQCPDEMELSPKLLYDDAGYFIGISAAYTGQWTPRHSVYATTDEVHVIIELAGVKKGEECVKKDEAYVEVLEEAIIIRGTRLDFKETLSCPTILQEKIPTGQFTLEIPLGCRVDPDEANLERIEGLYKITCPKKKPKSKVF